MTIEEWGAVGEVVGAVGVIVSLVYLGHQIRLNSSQVLQNSKHIEASIYHATNEGFSEWYGLVASDATLADAWGRLLAGEELPREERVRVNALLAKLFLAFEANFQQHRLEVVRRDPLKMPALTGMLAVPGVARWWEREGPGFLTAEFREAVEALRRGDA